MCGDPHGLHIRRGNQNGGVDMKIFSITVDASPRYPMPKTYSVEATNWSAAIARATRQYFKDHKNLRPLFCKVRAMFISKVMKEGKDDGENS